jgi:alpha-1,3-mannosyltransferase
MPTIFNMRIVHVVRQFAPAIGGIESVVQELARAQTAAGHGVRIITLNRLFKTTELLPSRDAINGAEVIRIPFIGSSRYPLAFSAIKFIRDADIVHVHGIDFFFDYLAWTKPLHRKKLVVSTHGGFFHTPYAARLKRLYFATVTRLSLTWYDGVAAVSTSDHELFSRLRRRGIACIENGVNIIKYAKASAAHPINTIVWIGRFSTNKRLDRLMSFVAALRRQDGTWRLKIAGCPWDVDVSKLAALANEAGIADATEIFASPSETEIRGLLGGCSVLVSSSDFEGFGIAVVEGLSAGLFPVLSDISAFRRLVKQTGSGMVVDFSQSEAAATQFLAQWRKVTMDYQSMRKASIAAAAEFDWRRASRAYMDVYEAVGGARKRRILDVSVPVWTRSAVIEQLDKNFDQKPCTMVAFANANCVNIASADERVRVALGDAVVLNDGIGIDFASKLLFGVQFPDNLNGSDFTPYYLQRTRHRFRIYLLGGKPGVARRAVKSFIQTCPHHQIVGCRDGYFSPDADMLVAQAVRASGADVVLVAMGNPIQELWLRNNLSATGCRLGFAVGALFDFMAGETQRAPVWVRKLRSEWMYRLAREPQRLWRRYVVGNPLFILRVLGQWWSGARA